MPIIDLQPSQRQLAAIKVVLFGFCLLPLGMLVADGFADRLGANPVEAVTRGLGDWALRFLLLSLTITPLRKFSGWHWLIRLRRMLGLFCFFYAVLHVVAYVWADQFFDWLAIVDDILKRPFITVGFIAFALLVPLAATSSNAMICRLGGRNWQKLHRLVYPAALLGVLHFYWMVKLDTREALLYAAILAGLLGIRLYWHWLAGGFRPTPRICGR